MCTPTHHMPAYTSHMRGNQSWNLEQGKLGTIYLQNKNNNNKETKNK